MTTPSTKALGFRPHQFSTTVSFTPQMPTMLIEPTAYEKMRHIVDLAKGEVGWLGVVTRTPLGDFFISEVFLFAQEIHGMSNTITTDGLAAFSEEILSSREDAVDVLNNLRLWGHSHDIIETTPSHKDNEQIVTFAESGAEWFIRLIANKQGKLSFSVFFFKAGIAIHDVPWVLYQAPDESIRDEVQAEIARKVTIVPIPITKYIASGRSRRRRHMRELVITGEGHAD